MVNSGGHVTALASTTFAPDEVATIDGKPVLDQFGRLFAYLRAYDGGALGAILAIPEARFSTARALTLVTWFTDRPGPFRSFGELGPDERNAARRILAQQVAALAAVPDPEIRSRLRLVLAVPTEDDLFFNGTDVVVIRWGHLDGGGPGRALGRALAPYLPEGFLASDEPPDGSAPEGGSLDPSAAQAQSMAESHRPPADLPPDDAAPGTAASNSAALETGDAPSTARAAGSRDATPGGPFRAGAAAGGMGAATATLRPHDGLFALLALTGLLALFLAYILWPGNLIYPSTAIAPPAEAVAPPEADMLREIGRLQASLRENVCRPGAPGTGGSGPAAPGLPGAVAPVGNGLVQRLDQSTVFLIGKTADGVAMGSGILLGPRHVLTNFHVVEAVSGDVLVTSQRLGTIIPAKVVARSASSDIASDDFALLLLSSAVEAPQPVFATAADRLDTVVAAGYPSFVISTDPNFVAAFRDGDTSRISDLQLALTRGEITAKQPGPTGTTLIAHSASISAGNSGGPLVDACGRVVGVNTYVRTDAENSLRLNFALSARDAADFLKQHSQNVALEASACTVPAAGGPAQGAQAPPTRGADVPPAQGRPVEPAPRAGRPAQ